MPDYVLTQTIDRAFEILLHRPDKRNAIHWPMMSAIEEAIEEAEKTPGVRAVLIRGDGGVFSSGIDLTAFPEIAETFGGNWRERMPSVSAAFQGASPISMPPWRILTPQM